MFPLLSIIIAVALGMGYREIVPESRPADLPGVVLAMVAAWFLFVLVSRLELRRVRIAGEPERVAAMRSAFFQRITLLVAYGAVVYEFHWPQVTRVLGIDGWVLVDEFLILLPFFVLLGIALFVSWSTERRLGLTDFTAGAYLRFHTRQYLLPILPFAVFVLFEDLIEAGSRSGIRWVAEVYFAKQSYPFVGWIVSGSLLLLLFCLLPLALRFLWGMRSLPDGPVRERLEAFSRREGFKARDLLVWPTGGNVMNAAVIGIAAPFRYVLLTDAIIEELDLDELEAVFAHEVGHAKHNHLLLFFLYVFGYALLIYLVFAAFGTELAGVIGNNPLLTAAFGVGCFLLWFGILFGFISRRFEQQADVYGTLATGRAHGEGVAEGEADGEEGERHPFVRALERLASHFGDIREAKGWRHFSLGDRIRFVKEFVSREEVRRRYRRGMTALLVFFFGMLTFIGAAAAATIPRQLREGRVEAGRMRAAWLEYVGRHQESIDEYLRVMEYAREAGVEVDFRLATGESTPEKRKRILTLHAWTQAPDISPGEKALLYYRLARAYLDIGEVTMARDSLQEAMKIAGDHPMLLPLMGEILFLEGRRKGALLAFRDALAKVPADSDYAARMREWIGRLEGAR